MKAGHIGAVSLALCAAAGAAMFAPSPETAKTAPEPEKKPDQTPSGATFTPYLVRITASVLNIRKGPGTTYAVTGQIKDRGVYTIVEQKGNWGRLKSGAGWISLSYTKKV